MKLSKQVCSLEQAKRLKELGVAQEALFYVVQDEDGTTTVYPRSEVIGLFADAAIDEAAERAGNPSQFQYDQNKVDAVAEKLLSAALKEKDFDGVCAAYSVAELGGMLLAYPEIGHSFYCENVSGNKGRYGHTWSIGGRSVQPCEGWYTTEAQARAAMLIALLESGKITAETVNARLSD